MDALLWILLGGVAVTMVLHRWSRRLHYRGTSLDGISRYLDSMLRRMRAGAVLVADREAGDGFLQLALTHRTAKQLRIELGLPDLEWSAERFDTACQVLTQAGFVCEVEHDPDNPRIRRFLRAACEGSEKELRKRGAELLVLVAGALGFTSTETYTVRLAGEDTTEYNIELARQVEDLPSAGRLHRGLAAIMRRLV